MSKANSNSQKNLKWWQLSLFGIGCIIGTGFFLGSSIAIRQSGPSVIIAFIAAGLATYIVFDALARMTAKHPEKGSFRTYSKQAFGHWAGFSNGWIYWSSELLIMGSQLTALGIFSKFWFPNVPLWLFATVYGSLGILIIVISITLFQRFENIIAVIKVAAIVMFIIIAGLAIFGVLDGERPDNSVTFNYNGLFPNGFMGFWTGLIYAFYAFGGIEVMGIMANDLKEPTDAPKAGKFMVSLLVIVYVLSIGMALYLLPWDTFTTEDSPFIEALDNYNLNFVPHVFNGALIIAGFSTMVASLYAITTIMVSLAEDGDAPKLFAKVSKRNMPYRALGLTILGLIISIVVSLLLPDRIYEHFTTGAGLMLLYTWLFILFSYKKLAKITVFRNIKLYFGIGFILLAVSGTLFDGGSRPGFFISISFLALIIIIAYAKRNKWKHEKKKPTRTTVFDKMEKE